MSTRRTWLVLICILAGLVCYYLPWYTHITAGFTMHAFDLAEWSSLHPAVRSESPELWTSLLLRLPQVALLAGLVLVTNGLRDARMRWLWRAIAVLFALRLLPPTDFFSGASQDPNYRQMMLLSAVAVGLMGGALLLYRLPAKWQMTTLAGVLLAGLLAGWMGLSRTQTLLDNFAIDVQLGPGIWGLSAVSVAAIVLLLWPLRQVLGATTEA